MEVNGSVVPGATSLAHYNRHASGHDEVTGSFVALLSNLAVDDVVTISVQREGNGGIVTAPEGGKVALQAKAAYSAAAGDTSPPKLASFVGLGLDGFQANLEDFGLSVDAASIKAVVDGAEAAVTTSKDGYHHHGRLCVCLHAGPIQRSYGLADLLGLGRQQLQPTIYRLPSMWVTWSFRPASPPPRWTSPLPALSPT